MIKHLIFLCICALGRAEPHSVSKPTVDDSPWKLFMESLGAPLFEAPGNFNFTYVSPNEHMGHLVEPCLEPDGALISVGTFRGLNNASSGRVKHLVMLDYDEGVTLFNTVMLQILHASKDRFQFISRLFTGEDNIPLIEEARNKKLSTQQFLDQLLKPFTEKVNKNKTQKLQTNIGVELAPKWRKLGVRLPNADDWKKLSAVSENNTLEWHLYNDRKFPKVVKDWEALGGFAETLFANDERFKTVKKMANEGRITIAQGDVTSPTLIKNIGNALQAKGLKVSAMDVSNIPGYFTSDIPGEEIPNRTQRKKLLDNFKSLPLTEKAKLIMTSHEESGPSKDWAYYAIDHRDTEGLGLALGPNATGAALNGTMTPAFTNYFKHDPADRSKHKQLYSSPQYPCSQK